MKPEQYTSKHSGREIEYKWKARDDRDYSRFLEACRRLKAKISKSRTVSIHDIYLDTPDKFFGNSRTKCRMRMAGGKSEITFKSFAESEAGLVNRCEKSVPIPRFKSKKSALKYCVNKYLKHVLGTSKIAPVFRLDNQRTFNKILLPGNMAAESCFDDVKISRGAKKVEMKEIELELLKGDIRGLKKFASKITAAARLKPAKTSKFSTAMTLLFSERKIPAAVKPGSSKYRFTRHDSIRFALRNILRTNLDRLKENEPGVRINMDPEALHDMRVASRRLRAALRLFKKILPEPCQKTALELRFLGRALGKKRDLDVLAREVPAFLPQAVIAHKNILKILNSGRYKNLLTALEHLTNESVSSEKNAKKSAKKFLRKFLKRAIFHARTISKESSDPELHPLRIAVKKLRYSLEFFEPVLPQKTSRLISHCREIQDILGGHQDAIYAIETLSASKIKGSRTLTQKFIRRKEEFRNRFFRKRKDFLLRLLRF